MGNERFDTRKKERFEINKFLDRGTLDFKSKISRHDGSVMSLGSHNVVTVPPTMTIKGALETMTRYRFRRIPVTDPGTGKLLGMIGSSDIIDFIGGGDKFLLIDKKYHGNFLAAINDSVREVMATDVMKLKTDATVEDALKLMLESRVGGIVITNDEDRVEGMVTERDFVYLLAEKKSGKKVDDFMTREVVTTTLGTTLGDTAKIMVRNSFRRLPVTLKGFLEGIVTSRMIIHYLGSNEVFDRIVKNEIDEVLNVRIDEIMSRNVATMPPGSDLGDVAKKMVQEDTGTICIVKDSKLHGIITERDILKALVQ